jgi:hypothetical protein
MDILTGVVLVIAIIGIVLVVVGICASFGAISMIMDDYFNGPKAQVDRISYSERTPQGGKLEPFYEKMLNAKNEVK